MTYNIGDAVIVTDGCPNHDERGRHHVIAKTGTGRDGTGYCVEDLDLFHDESCLAPVPVAPAPDQDDEPEPANTWRVGRSQPHNLYLDNVHTAVVLGDPDDAAALAGQMVDALNGQPTPDPYAVEEARAQVTRQMIANTRHQVTIRERGERIQALTARAEHAEAEVQRLRERSDIPAPCDMTRTEPYDFAQCNTHDETFPLGGACKFHGRDSIAEVYADEARLQRGRAVKAEIERDAARAELAAAGTTDGPGLPGVGPVVRVPHGVGLLCDNALFDGDRSAEHWRYETRKALERAARYAALASFVAEEKRARLAQEAPTTKDDDR